MITTQDCPLTECICYHRWHIQPVSVDCADFMTSHAGCSLLWFSRYLFRPLLDGTAVSWQPLLLPPPGQSVLEPALWMQTNSVSTCIVNKRNAFWETKCTLHYTCWKPLCRGFTVTCLYLRFSARHIRVQKVRSVKHTHCCLRRPSSRELLFKSTLSVTYFKTCSCL